MHKDEKVEQVYTVLKDFLTGMREGFIRKTVRRGDQSVRYDTPCGGFWLTQNQQRELENRF